MTKAGSTGQVVVSHTPVAGGKMVSEEEIARVICCPGGCIRPQSTYAGIRACDAPFTYREEARAVLSHLNAAPASPCPENGTTTSACPSNLTTGDLSEVAVAPARMAILQLVPVGYGMTRDEADAYARAAIVAHHNASLLRAAYSEPGSPVVRLLSNEAAVVPENGQNGWRDINDPPERKPAPNENSSIRVLGILADGTHVFAHYNPFYIGRLGEEDHVWTCENYAARRTPTHWRYLPAPPSASKGG